MEQRHTCTFSQATKFGCIKYRANCMRLLIQTHHVKPLRRFHRPSAFECRSRVCVRRNIGMSEHLSDVSGVRVGTWTWVTFAAGQKHSDGINYFIKLVLSSREFMHNSPAHSNGNVGKMFSIQLLDGQAAHIFYYETTVQQKKQATLCTCYTILVVR